MVKITISMTKEGHISSLLVEGHAGSGPHGHDLVCASVSAVTFGGLNAIQEPNKFNFNVKEGRVEVTTKGEITTHDEVVLETMITQYKSIEQENKDFIKIMKKGC